MSEAFEVHVLLVVKRGGVGMRNKGHGKISYLPGLPDAARDIAGMAAEAMLRDLEKATFDAP